METNCVAGCCGLEAFSFAKKDIARVASTLGEDEFLAQLTKLREEISELTAELVCSDRLNYWDEK